MTIALEPPVTQERGRLRLRHAIGRAGVIVVAAVLGLGGLSMPARAVTAEAADGATATGPDAVVVGKAIRVSGTGWISPEIAGGGGSVIGVKLDDSVLTPKTPPINPFDNHPNTRVWAIVQANADGSWQVDLPFPTTANAKPESGFVAADWVAGTTHNVRLLTGSLKPNDAIRSVSLPFTVTLPPVSGATPKISGTATFGKKLTAKPGTWTKKAKLAYQWNRNGIAISGATKSTYKAAVADVGTKLTVEVTGSLAGYTSTSKTSAAATIKAAKLTTKTPKISGTAKVGKKLTAKPGKWTKSTAFTYQWLAGGVAIDGQTGKTLKLTTAQKGKTIKVEVTGPKAGYATAAKTSKATKKVKK